MTNANQSEEKRIYELDEIASLSPGLYVPVDQASLEMAKKFDLGTSLAGKADATELDAVREEVESIGKPLKLMGSATVAELNGTIEDLQPGWTYTLTDSGTLTSGDVSVDAGDEVAWSESAVWVKIGGDSGKTAVFEVNLGKGMQYPAFNDVKEAVDSGKVPVLHIVNYNGTSDSPADYFHIVNYSSAPNFHAYSFSNGKEVKTVNSSDVWSSASAYDSALNEYSTNAVQNSTLYAIIGDVETLLAAL